MNDFADHFSRQSENYSKFRPQYPADLFKYLAGLSSRHDLAWDCATGNGQAALGLTPYFKHIIATDASDRQIHNARRHEKISYRVALAEQSNIEAYCVDLIVVAQALHWFDFNQFYKEVKRVLRPEGIFSAWTYTLSRISPEIDGILDRFHHEIIAEYWPPQRKLVDNHYRDIPFPFTELSTPEFRIESRWNLDRLLDYLRTWSAVLYYQDVNQRCPTELIRDELHSLWGDAAVEKPVYWPLTLRAGIFE